MESSSLLPLFPCSMMVSRARVLYSCRAAEEFRKGGGAPGREAAAAESPPIWEQWQEGGTGKRVEGEAGSKASPLFFKELRSQNERKRISPPFTQGLQSFFENDVRKERQSWKGTRKKVRFLPRELKHFKSQYKSAVNAFGRNTLPLGTGNWPADTVNYSQGKKNIAWKDINWKETQWPSFPLLSWFILSPFSETLPHISKMPSSHEDFPDQWNDTV